MKKEIYCIIILDKIIEYIIFSAKIAKQGRGSFPVESERLSQPLIGRIVSLLSSDWLSRTQPSSGAAVVWSEPEPVTSDGRGQSQSSIQVT